MRTPRLMLLIFVSLSSSPNGRRYQLRISSHVCIFGNWQDYPHCFPLTHFMTAT